MDAVLMLLKDHEKIRSLLSQFRGAGEGAHKQKLLIVDETIETIRVHCQLEERLFYPALQQRSDKEMHAMILERIEEHRVADFLMDRIKQTRPEDETIDAKFDVLTQIVKAHLEQEEQSMFSEADRILGEDLEPMATEMESLARQME